MQDCRCHKIRRALGLGYTMVWPSLEKTVSYRRWMWKVITARLDYGDVIEILLLPWPKIITAGFRLWLVPGILFLLFFSKTALLRYISSMIKLTHLKYTTHCFPQYTHRAVSPTPPSSFRTFQNTPERNLEDISSHSPLPNSPASGKHLSTFSICLFQTFHINGIVHVVFCWLASFT